MAELLVNKILERVKSAAQLQKAAVNPDASDPADKGGVGVPKDGDSSPDKANMPGNSPVTPQEGTKAEDRDTKPVSVGKNVPGTEDGNARDEAATSPTTPLSKIAEARKAADAIIEKLKSAGDASKEAEKEKQAKQEKQEKAGGNQTLGDAGSEPTFGDDELRKLGALMLTTEGAIEQVTPLLEEAAGVKEAQAIVRGAVEEWGAFEKAAYEQAIEEAEMEKIAAVQEGMAYEAAETALAAYAELTKDASEDDMEQIEKLRKIAEEADYKYETVEEKQAFAQGMQDATDIGDQLDEGKPEDEITLDGADAAAPADPGMVVEEIQAAVEKGDLQPEVAEQVIQALLQGEGAAAEPGGDEMSEELGKAASVAEELIP